MSAVLQDVRAPRRMDAAEVSCAAAAAGPPAAGLLTPTGELVACTANWRDATGLDPRVPLLDAIHGADAVDLVRALGRGDRRLSTSVRAGRRDALVETLLVLDGAFLDGAWHVTARRSFQRRRTSAHVEATVGPLQVTESLGDAVWVAAVADGRIVHANPAWRSLAGPDADAARGWAGWAHPRDRVRVAEEVAHWLADGANAQLRCAFAAQDPDGAERQLVAVASAVLGVDGDVAYLTGVAMDVTALPGLGGPAGTDPLTGLLDRRGLEQALGAALDRCRQGDSAALILIDLDGFKAVNDAHGHGIGDELLASVGERLQAAVRDGDVAARLGGDEFAVVLRRSTPTEARAAAERLLSAVRRARPVSSDAPAAVDGSAGLAPLAPGEELTVAEALRRADLALYEAKAAGRGATSAYPTRDRRAVERLQERRSAGQRLFRALRDDALELHARPVVDLHDGGLVAWDLGVRVDGADAEAPVEADAHRAGLTAHLDHWKLRRLVEEAARDAGAPLGVVVDASALDDPALATRLETDLARAGADPRRLIVGVSGAGGCPGPQARATARALRRLGVELLLDDFGASPGSLALLRALPVSVIRIADGLACAQTANAFDDSVVRYAADLACEFGLGVVADGIGSAADLERLRALGAHAGLGPHLGALEPLDIAFARTPPRTHQEDADECA